MSCILFKKYFLDNQEGVNPSDYDLMRETVMNSLDFKTQPMMLLKRKGDLISKVFMLQDKNEELLQKLVEWAQSDDSVAQQLSMYIFEKQAECHLTDEQLNKYQGSFHSIFEKSLSPASDMKVRVAALLATTSFLLSVQDKTVLSSFQDLMQPILNTVVEAL